jgi:RimJ/RimL family protein N-acetyltransferase
MNTTQNTHLPTTFTRSTGQPVTIRPIRSSDAALLIEMFHHLSEHTRRLRFHSYTGNLPQERIWREAIALSDLDPTRQAALVAVHQDGEGEHIVGVARFARATADAVEAEAAIAVRDDWQKMGLGTHLLTLLVPLARSMGIERFFAWIMAENIHMLRIVKKADLPMRRETHPGEVFVVVSLEP